jgi:FecR protein
MAWMEHQNIFRRVLARLPQAGLSGLPFVPRPMAAVSVGLVSLVIALTVVSNPSEVGAATKKKPAKKPTTTQAVPTVQRVDTRSSDKGKYTQLKKSAAIKVGSQLKTNADGKARLDYVDGSYTRISNATELTVLELATAKKPQTRLKLANGQVWNRVKKAAGGSTRYEVETPTAVAAVQGTAFNVRCVLGVCDFAVVEGTVRVSAANGAPVLLTPNQQVRVDAAGVIGAVQPFAVATDPWVTTNVNADVVEAAATTDEDASTTTTTLPGGGGGGVTAAAEAFDGQWQFTAVNFESNVTIAGNYADRPGETFTVPVSFAPTAKPEFLSLISPELQIALPQILPPGEIEFVKSSDGFGWIASPTDGYDDCLLQRYIFDLVTDPLAADGRATSMRGELNIVWSYSSAPECTAATAKVGGLGGGYYGSAKFRLTIIRN